MESQCKNEECRGKDPYCTYCPNVKGYKLGNVCAVNAEACGHTRSTVTAYMDGLSKEPQSKIRWEYGKYWKCPNGVKTCDDAFGSRSDTVDPDPLQQPDPDPLQQPDPDVIGNNPDSAPEQPDPKLQQPQQPGPPADDSIQQALKELDRLRKDLEQLIEVRLPNNEEIPGKTLSGYLDFLHNDLREKLKVVNQMKDNKPLFTNEEQNNQLNQLRQKVEALKLQLQQQSQQPGNNQQMIDAQKRINQLEEQVKDCGTLQQQIEELKKELLSKTKELEQLNIDILDIDKPQGNLSDVESQQLRNDKDRLNDRIQELIKQVNDDEISKLMNKKQAQEQIDALQDENLLLQQRLNELSQQQSLPPVDVNNDQLKKDYDLKEKEYLELLTRHNQLNERLNNIMRDSQKEILELRQLLQECNKNLEKCEQNSGDTVKLRNELTELNRYNKELDNKNKDLENEYQQAKQYALDLQKKVQLYQKEHEILKELTDKYEGLEKLDKFRALGKTTIDDINKTTRDLEDLQTMTNKQQLDNKNMIISLIENLVDKSPQIKDKNDLYRKIDEMSNKDDNEKSISHTFSLLKYVLDFLSMSVAKPENSQNPKQAELSDSGEEDDFDESSDNDYSNSELSEEEKHDKNDPSFNNDNGNAQFPPYRNSNERRYSPPPSPRNDYSIRRNRYLGLNNAKVTQSITTKDEYPKHLPPPKFESKYDSSLVFKDDQIQTDGKYKPSKNVSTLTYQDKKIWDQYLKDYEIYEDLVKKNNYRSAYKTFFGIE